MPGKVSKPNNPPTLADALAPGLDAEQRLDVLMAFHAVEPNFPLYRDFLLKLLDAHARDARIAGINEALKIIRDHEFPCGGVHACPRCSMAAQIDTLLEDDHAQR